MCRASSGLYQVPEPATNFPRANGEPHFLEHGSSYTSVLTYDRDIEALICMIRSHCLSCRQRQFSAESCVSLSFYVRRFFVMIFARFATSLNKSASMIS